MSIDLRLLQAELRKWEVRNFGEGDPLEGVVGATEEVGELAEVVDVLDLPVLLGRLAHAQLKLRQGIRATPEELNAKGKDAIGDIFIYLINLCSKNDWDAQSILLETSRHVLSRDWKSNPTDANEQASVPAIGAKGDSQIR